MSPANREREINCTLEFQNKTNKQKKICGRQEHVEHGKAKLQEGCMRWWDHETSSLPLLERKAGSHRAKGVLS